MKINKHRHRPGISSKNLATKICNKPDSDVKWLNKALSSNSKTSFAEKETKNRKKGVGFFVECQGRFEESEFHVPSPT